MSKLYRKKPVVVEAVQFTREAIAEVVAFTGGQAHDFCVRCDKGQPGVLQCIVPTLEGQHIATEGDYIIKGVKGEFYPCKPDIFEQTYEVVGQPQTNADLRHPATELRNSGM